MLISDKMYFKTDCNKKRGRAFHNEKRVDPKNGITIVNVYTPYMLLLLSHFSCVQLCATP